MMIAEKIPLRVLEQEARERYRQIHGAPAQAPDPVNADAAIAVFEPVPLLWSGREYPVRNIGYREGLKLQKLTLRFHRTGEQDAGDEAAIEAHEALLEEILALFWSFLDPKPHENPFLDATPLEVGALSGFFFTCQRLQNSPDRMAGIRLSRTTT